MFNILIPIVLGCLSVLQNGLNRSFGLNHGLATAVLVNVSFATVISLLFWFAVRGLAGGEFGWLSGTLSFDQLKLWHFLPGFFGFLIVLGLPFAMNQLGSTQVFVGFIAAQIVTSLLWDIFVVKSPVLATRILGAALTVAGVLLVSLR